MTSKQRAILGALRDAQYEHDGQAVSAGQVAAVCSMPWHQRPHLVSQALVLLERDGLVRRASGSARAWKMTAAGRLTLAPRSGRARSRPSVGGKPHAR